MTIYMSTNELKAMVRVLKAAVKPRRSKDIDTRFIYLEMRGRDARLTCGDAVMVFTQRLYLESPVGDDYRSLSIPVDDFVSVVALMNGHDREAVFLVVNGTSIEFQWGVRKKAAIEASEERALSFWTYFDPQYHGGEETLGKPARFAVERLKAFTDAYKILNGKPPVGGEVDMLMRGECYPALINMGSGLGLLMPLHVAQETEVPNWVVQSSFAWEDMSA